MPESQREKYELNSTGTDTRTGDAGRTVSNKAQRGRPARTTQPVQSEQSAPLSTRAGRKRGTSSFEARFGRVILEHGIAAIPAGLFHFQRALELDAKHLWFVSYILSCKWDADLPYPSLNKMERCTGVDIQALYRYKKALIAQGYLSVCKRLTERGGYDTDAYDFSGLFDHLEECIAGEQAAPNAIRADGPVPTVPAEQEGLDSDSSFVARYGRVIVRYGVAAIPKAIFSFQSALRLTPQQVWFVGYILSFRWDSALPYPSIEKMALCTGYNRTYLHEIKRSLVEAGYLRLVHRANEQGGQDTNAYDFSGLLEALKEQLQGPEPGQEMGYDPGYDADLNMPFKVRNSTIASLEGGVSSADKRKPGSTSRHPGITRHTGVGIAGHTPPAITGETAVGISGHTYPGIIEHTGAGIAGHTRPVKGSTPAHLLPGIQGVVSGSRHESESVQTETMIRDDSNSLSPKKNGGKTKPPDKNADNQTLYSPYIAAVISDFSSELDDQNHTVSNVTQALRLYSRSGLSESEFSELLFEARKLVRSYQGKNGLAGIGNKMGYFFATLRDLIPVSAGVRAQVPGRLGGLTPDN